MSTILGNDALGGLVLANANNRKVHSPYALASAGVLDELHSWFRGGGGQNIIISIYTDTGGVPDARVAYTNSLSASTDPQDVNQTGFNVPLPAGTYWIGVSMETGPSGGQYYIGTGNQYKGILAAPGYNPPSDPYGTVDFTNATRNLCVWAVVGDPAPVVSGSNPRPRRMVFS